MQERGQELLTRALELAALARGLIGAIDGVQLLDDDVLGDPSVGARDPLKLVVDVARRSPTASPSTARSTRAASAWRAPIGVRSCRC